MKEEEPKSLRESLAEGAGKAPWSMLEAHAKREGLIEVASCLDILEVAIAIAEDRSGAVAAWMSAGHLSKPDAEAMERNAQESEAEWSFVIVAPFVLIQAEG